MVFNPFDEPTNRYGLNEYGVNAPVIIGLIPVVGLAAMGGSLLYALERRQNNPYNLCNVAWNTAVVSAMTQLIWGVAFLVGYML